MRAPFLFVVIAGFVLPSVTGCREHEGAGKAVDTERPSASVARAAMGNIAHTLSLAGQFQPYQVVDIHPKVTGFMVKINVDIGDRVRKGQTLAVLEVPELNAQLRGAGFEIKQAQDEQLRAQHEIRRVEALHAAVHADYQRLVDAAKGQPGLIAQQELDDAQSKDLSAEALVDSAKAAASAAQEHSQVANADNDRVQAMKNYTNVVAPLDGVIVWRYADTGALIQSGTNSNEQDIPIVRLSQSGLLRLRMAIPENDVRYVHEDEPIQVRVDAIGRSFTGRVVRFTRDVNFETRTMETEIDVPNHDLSISPGMYANAQLQLAIATHVLTVPVESLVLKGAQTVAYVLDADNRVHLRPVQVGLRGSKLAEIKGGLAEGDRVIVGGQEKYVEGEQVAPVMMQPPTNDTMHEAGGVIDLKSDAGNGGDQ
jgi:RND family efflux transporter MFP subunit